MSSLSSISSSSSSLLLESSSCFSAGFELRGRHGTGVAQAPHPDDYPLVLPSEDIRFLLADAYLAYENPRDYDDTGLDFEPPFHFAWLFGLGCLPSAQPPFAPDPTHAVDVLIHDNNDEIVFDSTIATSFLSRDWGDRFRLYEWKTETDVFRLVVHTKWSEDDDPLPRDYDLHLTPASAVLDARAPFRLPKRVKSFKVVLTTMKATDVEWVEGFNVDLTDGGIVTSPGRRFRHRVEISAAPGGGTGRFPGCVEEEIPIRTLNSVAPLANGDFLLAASGCFWLRQPTTIISASPRIATPTPATIQAGNSCGPCCPCEEYVKTVQFMNRLRDEYQELGEEAEDTRDQFKSNISRWNRDKSCRESQPLRLVVVPSVCPFVEVAGQFCNQSDQCVGPVSLTFSIAMEPVTTAEVSCGSTIRTTSVPRDVEPYELLGDFPTFTSTWDGVNPFDTVNVRFRLTLPNDGISYAVTITLSGTLSGSPIAQTIEKTVGLNCPDPCENAG